MEFSDFPGFFLARNNIAASNGFDVWSFYPIQVKHVRVEHVDYEQYDTRPADGLENSGVRAVQQSRDGGTGHHERHM